MTLYRKKPVEIEALQFDGSIESAVGIVGWIESHGSDVASVDRYATTGDWAITIKTFEGNMKVSSSDWVIRGIQGEFYPCKPDIFALTYDEVAD